MFREGWEEKFMQANKLLAQRKLDDAWQFLQQASEDAAQDGCSSEAAFFSSVLGSAFTSQNRNDDALAAYLRAEKLEPDAVQHKLSIANLLLFGFGQAERALAKGSEALSLSSNPTDVHCSRSVLGLAYLEAGDQGAAICNFAEMAKPDVVESLPASACDLRLTEALLEKAPTLERFEGYLQQVLQKAEDGKDLATLERVRSLLGH